MSEEKIIYEPEEYGIDGEEFFITEAGEVKMAEDVNEILGGEFICDVLMKSLTDTTNHTLKARWTASKSITLPTPTRTGYTFQGWATSASGSVAY